MGLITKNIVFSKIEWDYLEENSKRKNNIKENIKMDLFREFREITDEKHRYKFEYKIKERKLEISEAPVNIFEIKGELEFGVICTECQKSS